jgi:hypothetical protein
MHYLMGWTAKVGGSTSITPHHGSIRSGNPNRMTLMAFLSRKRKTQLDLTDSCKWLKPGKCPLVSSLNGVRTCSSAREGSVRLSVRVCVCVCVCVHLSCTPLAGRMKGQEGQQRRCLALFEVPRGSLS